MKYYSYDNDGFYIGEGVCQVDPLESKAQGKDIFLMPSNATTKKPLIQEGKISVFINNEWINKDDTKGIYYHTETKEQVLINDINADLTNLTKLEPDSNKKWNGSEWVDDPILVAYSELSEMDAQIPRIAEDFYDILNDEQKANLYSGLREGIELKKQKREIYLGLLNE